MASRIGRLVPSRTVLLLCDLQEKFAPSIQHFKEIVETSVKLAECAKLLNIPIIVTEHYPKGLGRYF
jgi:nicotinamidase-related amidase